MGGPTLKFLNSVVTADSFFNTIAVWAAAFFFVVVMNQYFAWRIKALNVRSKAEIKKLEYVCVILCVCVCVGGGRWEGGN